MRRAVRWSAGLITTLAIQKLVGGRKEAINAYLEMHEEGRSRPIMHKPSFNRKPEPITEMIHIAEESTAFPWGKPETSDSPSY